MDAAAADFNRGLYPGFSTISAHCWKFPTALSFLVCVEVELTCFPLSVDNKTIVGTGSPARLRRRCRTEQSHPMHIGASAGREPINWTMIGDEMNCLSFTDRRWQLPSRQGTYGRQRLQLHMTSCTCQKLEDAPIIKSSVNYSLHHLQ